MLSRHRNSSAEVPVLRLGLAGFTALEQAALNAVMASRATRGHLSWQLAELGEADAWCVNGSRVQQLPDGTLRILPGLPSGRSIRISLREIDWPVAFSTPLGAPDFTPNYLFDPKSPRSIEAVLKQLEGWLRPLMVQFQVAAHIAQENLDLRTGVFHVTVNGRLYATVSRRTGISVWPLADPAEVPGAVWSHRPDMADAVPSHFVRTDFAQLMWQYATRTTRDWLPPHYRTCQLFLRRSPRVPMRLLNDPSLLLVRELGSAPGNFRQLAQRTNMTDSQLARHLAALYMVGAITSDPKRAPPPRSMLGNAEWASSFNPDATGAATASPLLSGATELTVKLTVSGAGRLAKGSPKVNE